MPLRADKTLAAVTWKGAADLASLAGQPVRFRFQLRSGALFAFWVSPDTSGASYGYVAAGGPGFSEARDTSGAPGVTASSANGSAGQIVPSTTPTLGGARR